MFSARIVLFEGWGGGVRQSGHECNQMSEAIEAVSPFSFLSLVVKDKSPGAASSIVYFCSVSGCHTVQPHLLTLWIPLELGTVDDAYPFLSRRVPFSWRKKFISFEQQQCSSLFFFSYVSRAYLFHRAAKLSLLLTSLSPFHSFPIGSLSV